MKKTYMYTLAVVVIVVVAAAWFFVANKNSNSSNTSNLASGTNSMSMNMNGTMQTSRSSTGQPEATDAVAIRNFAFNPDNITVKAGTKVTWTNNDGTTHTVTESDGKTGPDSNDLAPGSSYSFTFTQPGTYHYHCTIHPEMVGTVTVTS